MAERRSGELSSHILPTSATMVGVCVTVLSIVKLASPGLGYIIDKLLALGSLVFLTSANVFLRVDALYRPASHSAPSMRSRTSPSVPAPQPLPATTPPR